MNAHRRIASWLSIVFGAMALISLVIGFMFFSVIFSLIKPDPAVTTIVMGFGSILGVIIGLLALSDILAGAYYLRGSKVAETFLIVLNVFHLFAFPIGTLIGGYSLWAILGSGPRSPAAEASGVTDA